VIKATGGWTSRLRQVVDRLAPEQRAAAERALNDARAKALKAQYTRAERRFGVDPVDVGTAGFRSDIDVTLYPKELNPSFKGQPRDVSTQIRAAAVAARDVANGLRRRFGGDPEVTLDVAVHAYIGEDIPPIREGEPARRAAAGLEQEVAFAELRRGTSDAEWAEVRRTIESGLPVGPDLPDAVRETHEAARRQLIEVLERAEQFKTSMDEQMQRMQEEIIGPRGQGASTEDIQAAARDQLLLVKRLKLAELFSWSPRDWAQIERLQAEIRWLAPGAYAGAAAYQSTVRHGQARKEAANVAKSFAERAAENRSPAERQAELTATIASHLAMLQKHLGERSAPVKDALKYAGRALTTVEESGMTPPEGLIPSLLREFKQSRWGDADPSAIDRILAKFGEQSGLADFVERDADGNVTRIKHPLPWVLVDRINRWMIDQLGAQATRSATMNEHAWEVPSSPPKPPPVVTPDPFERLSASLSQSAVEALSHAMTTQQALSIATWLGYGRLETAAHRPAELQLALKANERLTRLLDDPLALRGLLRLTEEKPPGRTAPTGNAKLLDVILRVPEENLGPLLRALGDPAFPHPQGYGHDKLIKLGEDPGLLEFIGEHGYEVWGELVGSPEVGARLRKRLSDAPDAAARDALVAQLLEEPSTVARERILGIERPPPRRPLTEAKANEKDPSWPKYLSDAKRVVGAQGEAAIRAYATILQVRDRITASWAKHQALPQATKERLLDQLDRIGVQGGLPTGLVNNARGRVGEALFAPHGGVKQVTLPNPLHPAKSGGPGFTRLDDRFEPGERPGSTSGVREWVEVKTDLIGGAPRRGDVNQSAVATAERYAAGGLADWHALLANASTRTDRVVIQFARKPGDPNTRQAMIDKLFSTDSPFSAIRFGDEPWLERPADHPMPPIPVELAAGPIAGGNGSTGSTPQAQAPAPAPTPPGVGASTE
jgi:hypothetical protein